MKQRFLTWLRAKLAVPPTVQLSIRTLDASEASITEWRRLKVNVSASRRLLDDPVMKGMVALLEEESPLSSNPPPNGSDPVHLTRILGQEEGYRNCLLKLQAFGILIEDQTEPDPDFSNAEL